MPSARSPYRRPTPTARQLLEQREADAGAKLSEVIVRLEGHQERVEVAKEAYQREVDARDAVALEAHGLGLSQDVIAGLTRMAQPNVVKMLRRARERQGQGIRE